MPKEKDEREGIQLPVTRILYELVPRIVSCRKCGKKMTHTTSPFGRRLFKCKACDLKTSLSRHWFDHVPANGVTRDLTPDEEKRLRR